MNSKDNHFVFVGDTLLTNGTLGEVAFRVRDYHRSKKSGDNPLIFNGRTGRQTDVDMTISAKAFEQRYGDKPKSPIDKSDASARGRGRPRIGVVGREVTLLPRQWERLETRRGGASATLRKLVDEARKNSSEEDLRRESQDRTHNLMMALAGDKPGFEEACRALYANSKDRFLAEIRSWPKDIVRVLRSAAEDAFVENISTGNR